MSATGSAKQKQMRDKQMASYLKKMGVIRRTMNCPMCHHLVGIESSFINHIVGCKGR